MEVKLYEAAEKGSFETVSGMRNWQQQQTPTGNNVLHIHVGKSSRLKDAKVDFIQHVLEDAEGYGLMWNQNSNGDTPLHLAAKFGQSEAVEVFLERVKKPADEATMTSGLLSITNKHKDTALHEAARGGHSQVVKLLVEAGDPNICSTLNDKSETPLYLAAESGSTGSVHSILQTCDTLDLTCKGPCGFTALHAAVQRGTPEMVQELLERDRTLASIQNDEGLTPLHCAAERRRAPHLWKILLENEMTPLSTLYIQDNEGRTPLHIAVLGQNFEALDKMIESCPDCIEIVDNNRQNVLHYIFKRRSSIHIPWLAKQALHLDKYINDRDKYGNTPLHLYATAIQHNTEFPFTMRKLTDTLRHYPTLDLKAVDNQNRSVGDIFRSKLAAFEYGEYRKIKRLPRGRQGNIYEKDAYDLEEALTKSRSRGVWGLENIRKAAESRLVVAALIATVSFTAGFTVPGGLDQNQGKRMGMPVFQNKTWFKVFLLSDATAFIFSTVAIWFYFLLPSSPSVLFTRRLSRFSIYCIIISVGAMMVAFLAAVCPISPKVLGYEIVALSAAFFIVYFYISCPCLAGLILSVFSILQLYLRRIRKIRIYE